MSLKEKCLQLKQEIMGLKKKDKEPPKPPINPKDLRDIIFPKEKSTHTTIIEEVKTPRSGNSFFNSATARIYSNKENYNTINFTQSPVQKNKSYIKNEVSNIKSISDVPPDFVTYFKERRKEKSFTSLNFTSVQTSTKRNIDDDESKENHEKRKKAILISRFLKEEDEKKVERRSKKEDFATTCQRLYKQKKDTNLQNEIKALISKKNKIL